MLVVTYLGTPSRQMRSKVARKGEQKGVQIDQITDNPFVFIKLQRHGIGIYTPWGPSVHR